jgi:RimJ/RimL family protein N-acetyltransferase
MGAQQIDTRIETDRLVLRPPLLSDAADLAGLIDRNVAEMTAGVPFPASKATIETFLDRVRAEGPKRHRLFVITSRRDEPLGVLGFHYKAGAIFELGYWLGASFRGRGVATEAVTAAMGWARDIWGARVAASGHFIDNPASGRVLEKAGFLYTGVVEPQFSFGRDCEVKTRLMIWLA